MIYSRRALLALFAVLALSSASVLAAPDAPDAPPAPVSPARARRAEREAEKEAAAPDAAAAPAPAKAKKTKNATAAADAKLPATGKPNTKYFVNARSALYTPAAKGSDKPGTLRLEGIVPTVLGEVKSKDGTESNVGRVTAAQLFGGPKIKQRLPVFDKKEGGMDVVLMGAF